MRGEGAQSGGWFDAATWVLQQLGAEPDLARVEHVVAGWQPMTVDGHLVLELHLARATARR
ncbi:MAG TPA: hypothetical protein VFH03_06350 [Actinoplanes sp.]|nr:hypothetical protein [Actinoplanes sp.]